MFLIRDEPLVAADESRGVGGVMALFRRGFRVVTVALQPRGIRTEPTAGWFPAILDSGCSGAFNISTHLFNAWVGTPLAQFVQTASVQIRGTTGSTAQAVPRYDAALWIRSNQGGVPPVRIELDRGFALTPGNNPPVPVIGVRTEAEGRLTVSADSHAGVFSVYRPRRLFGRWLVESGRISEDQRAAALQQQRLDRALPHQNLTAVTDPAAMIQLLRTEVYPPHLGCQLGTLAVERQLLPPSDWASLVPQNGPVPPHLGEVLRQMGVLSDRELADALADFERDYWG